MLGVISGDGPAAALAHNVRALRCNAGRSSANNPLRASRGGALEHTSTGDRQEHDADIAGHRGGHGRGGIGGRRRPSQHQDRYAVCKTPKRRRQDMCLAQPGAPAARTESGSARPPCARAHCSSSYRTVGSEIRCTNALAAGSPGCRRGSVGEIRIGCNTLTLRAKKDLSPPRGRVMQPTGAAPEKPEPDTTTRIRHINEGHNHEQFTSSTGIRQEIDGGDCTRGGRWGRGDLAWHEHRPGRAHQSQARSGRRSDGHSRRCRGCDRLNHWTVHS